MFLSKWENEPSSSIETNNHRLQTNPMHHKKGSQNANSHKTSGKQSTLSLSLFSYPDYFKTRKDAKYCITKQVQNTEPTQKMGASKTMSHHQQQQNHCLRMDSSTSHRDGAAYMHFTDAKFSPYSVVVKTHIV